MELFSTPPKTPAEIKELTQEDEALLDQLVQVVLDSRNATELLEPKLHKAHPDLIFKLRTRFGSYPTALGVLAKREIGDRPTRKGLLSKLGAMYASGAPITLDGLVRADARLARDVLIEFGTLDAVFQELDVSAAAATKDRRWDRDELFRRGLDFLTSPTGGLPEAEISAKDAVFYEALRHGFGSFHAFQREFSGWLSSQRSVAVMYGRAQLGRVLLCYLPETLRAARGRRFPEVAKLQQITPVMPGQRMFAVSPQGLLYPVDGTAVPLLFPSEESELPSYRVSQITRGARDTSLLAWGDHKGILAIATRKGRVKTVDLELIRRVYTAGVIVATLEEGDRVAAAEVVPEDFQRLLVVTENGRAVALERDALRQKSRKARGILRVRFEEDDSVVAVLGIREKDDVLLLGDSGNVLRIRSTDITSRRSLSIGRLVWKSKIRCAAVCWEGCSVIVGTRRARMVLFAENEIPRRGLRRRGVAGITLDSDDVPEALACF